MHSPRGKLNPITRRCVRGFALMTDGEINAVAQGLKNVPIS